MTTRAPTTKKPMTTRTLIPFLALTFALTWGIATLLIVAPEDMERIFGPMGYTNVAFTVAVYGPAIAAVLLALVAIVIVLRNPAMMLRGEGAVTDVLMEERDADARRRVEGSSETRCA